ncbi:EAL domain-containing protein [Cognaticolwellia aestuarii]|uniref:bifunctional diguanylate cyclase/phosphodiesterase n=1 Tax=Cognaticolwellia aestuarii TaxID=329993 RepID=UPI001930EE37|nr:EAL domain-containing protein [Cognaticolwellia aestuarii]
MTVKLKHRPVEDKILLTVTALAILVILPFLIGSIQSQETTAIIIDLLAVLGSSIIFSGVWFSNNTKFYSSVLAVFMQALVLVALKVEGASLLYWVFPIVIATFYLLSPVTAILCNSLFITLACFISYQQFDNFTLHRIIGALVLTNMFACALSLFMQTKNRQLSEQDKINKVRNNILELIARSSKLSKVLPAVIKGIEHEYPNAMCSILLLDKAGKHLTLGAAPSLPDFYNEAVEGIEIGKGMGSCGTAAYTRKRVIVSDIATHPYWAAWTALAKKAQLAACWSEPIIDNQGNVLGTFAIYHNKISAPKELDFKLIEQFANLARIAIEREKANKIIWQQANFDSLTNLPNRNLLHEHLTTAVDNAKRNQEQLAIIMLDLDNFKDVNDSLGHNAGDILLIDTAKRIKQCLRKNDIVARLGGDEFIIVLVGTSTDSDIDNIGQKLLNTLAQPYTIEQKSVYCTASIGIALYPNDALSIDALLRNADQAMYGAKARGRNSIHYFTENMHINFLKRMEIIQDLRIALTEQQFHLVYQPIVDLTNNRIAKAEALIRWQHPEKGLISPLDFISVAEETGLIVEISEWVFNEVSQQVQKWRNSHCHNLMISINTSPVQYRNKGQQIIAWAKSLLQQNIPPEAISIEITENLLMENQAEVVRALDNIRRQGLTVSIDDFGTGYCSFSYLKNFSIDYLKIDKSFVQNMSVDNKDVALCEAIIVMANKLNIKVIAEGIETEQQREILIEAGCRLGQGYLLARPLSTADFEQLLINQNI